VKRFIYKIIIAAVFVVSALCLFTSCAGHSYEGVATKYLNAFVKFDYKTMYDLLTPGSQSAVTYDEFVEYHKKVYDLLKIQTVSIERGESIDNGTSKAFNYTATFKSSEYGEFKYDMQFEVYKKTKFYLVAWTPANVVPDMDWNDRIYSATTRGKRGEIFDRDGRALVINDYAITVYGIKNNFEGNVDSVCTQVAQILGTDAAKIKESFNKSNGDTGIFATMFKGELTLDQETKLLEIENVKINRDSITPIRYYPYGDALAQTLGYSTPITPEDREQEIYKSLAEGTRIGRSGLELQYDEYLQAKDGTQIYLLSDDSKRKTVLYDSPAQNGYDLKLTVDIIIQKSITDYMNENFNTKTTGTATIIEPTSGAVISMVSYPSYNANIYAFDKATNYGDLYTNAFTPLLNRNIQGTYPPGSIFKSIMATIGLDTQVVNANTVFPYENEIEYYSYEKDRWRPKGSNWSHYIVREAFRTAGDKGRLDMNRGLIWSDNIYFGWLAMKVGKANMLTYAEKLGIGGDFKFDLPVRKSQLATDFSTLDNQKLLADTGFGQAQVLFTPLQLCSTFSMFGNNGTIMQPYLVESICTTNENGELVPVKTTESKIYKQPFGSSVIAKVRSILERTATEGTGKSGVRGHTNTMRIAAKTGTAQTGTTSTGIIGWYAGLVIDGGEKDAVLVSCDEGDLKFACVNHIFGLLKD
jgi:penicillin-binding protein